MPQVTSWKVREERFESQESGSHSVVLISQTWKTQRRPLREPGAGGPSSGLGLSCPSPTVGTAPAPQGTGGLRSLHQVNPWNTAWAIHSSGGKGIYMYRARTMAWTRNPFTSQQLHAVGAVTNICLMEEETQAQSVRFAQGHRARR